MASAAGQPQAALHSRAQVWENSLCGCMNQADCCFGCCCLPCLWGRNVGEFNGDGKTCKPCMKHFFCICCTCTFAGEFRKEIRLRYNLAERPCNDCMVHCCCPCCAVIQEAAELKYLKRADPTGAYQAPSTQQEMSRQPGLGAVPPSGLAGTHAAPGENLSDKEKITETRTIERQRDADRAAPGGAFPANGATQAY